MRVLVLGGTGFLGRHLVEACLAAGHTPALFNRGLSDPRAFSQLEHLHGERDGDLAALLGARPWDAVFDTSAYLPREVRASARAVAAGGARAHYTFVSTISVYEDFSRTHEGDPVREHPEAESLPFALEHYGALKAACERALEEEIPGRVLAVRAGLILGPHDYDARFRYWLTRVARGGEVLAPGSPEGFVQFVDVRDLAGWMLRCAERGLTGTFNATRPGNTLTMRGLLEGIRAAVGGDARFTWVPDEVLVAHEVRPYSEMPFWYPAGPSMRPIEVSRATSEGLAHRPFAETIEDTWRWMTTGWDAAESVRANRKVRLPAGLTAERERAILDAAAR